MARSRHATGWTGGVKNGPAIRMMRDSSGPSRRRILAGLGAAATAPLWRRAAAQTLPPPPAMTIKEGPSGAYIFDPTPPASFQLGDRLRLFATNNLAQRIALGPRGLDGIPALDLRSGKSAGVDIALAQAGTFVLDARWLEDGAPKPLPIMAFVVAESAPPQVDQDRVLLIEDARVTADGASIAPGVDAADARTVYTINGQPNLDLHVRGNERLRLRLVNGCHRNPVALQFDDHDVRVMAIDSRPAEPFLARDRRVVLAPGTRADVLVDATRQPGSISAVQLFDGVGPKRIAQLVYVKEAPLRPEVLPAAAPLADEPSKLELGRALRAPPIEVGSREWVLPRDLVEKIPPSPLFRAIRGRTVLLTLSNHTTVPATFHLHSHHFRWLDRLDDGWKPFLLDTMLIDVGQTERIAFRADFPGNWLMEVTPMDWSAPRRAQWFEIS